jgi:hypothetical protein
MAIVVCSCNLEQKRIAEERARFVADSLAKREQVVRDSMIQVREREWFVRDSIVGAFNKKFIKTPQAKCRIVEDDYRTITWYNNPYFSTLNNYNYFTIYLGKNTRTNKVWIVNRVSLNLWDTFSRRMRYVGNAIDLIIDGEKHMIYYGNNVSLDYIDSGCENAIDFDTTISTELIVKIIKSKNPIQIVIYGDNGFKPLSRTLTSTEIKAIKSVYYQYLLLTK